MHLFPRQPRPTGALALALFMLGFAAPGWTYSPTPAFRNVERIVVSCWMPLDSEAPVIVRADTLCAAVQSALIRELEGSRLQDHVVVAPIGAPVVSERGSFTLLVRGTVGHAPSGIGTATLGLSFAIHRPGMPADTASYPPPPFVAAIPSEQPHLSTERLSNMIAPLIRSQFASPLLRASPATK